MELSIGKAFTLIVILFCINIVATATGMVPESWATKINPINADVNTISSKYYSGTIDTNAVNTTTIDTNATTTADKPNGVPFISDLYNYLQSVWQFLRALLFGWAGLIIYAGLPKLLTFGLIGVFAFLQIASIIFVFAWALSAIKGGGV